MESGILAVMGLSLQLHYASTSDLRAHLFEHAERGALLLPLTDLPPDLPQYAAVALEVVVGGQRCNLDAEVLQVLSGSGLVVRLTGVAEAELLVESAPIAVQALPPEVRYSEPELPSEEGPETELHHDDDDLGDQTDDAADGGVAARAGPRMAGSSPVSWSLEQLQAAWDQLSTPEKVRVARHGKRPARMLVLKGLDKTLHVHVLQNPGVTPEEVALMASMSSLDPAVLRRIAADTQWLQHSAVARNLVCNPKLTLQQIDRILRYVSPDELGRLARTGKVRQAVKQIIIRRLDRTR